MRDYSRSFAWIASQIAAGNAHPFLVGIKNPAEMFHILDTFPEVHLSRFWFDFTSPWHKISFGFGISLFPIEVI